MSIDCLIFQAVDLDSVYAVLPYIPSDLLRENVVCCHEVP